MKKTYEKAMRIARGTALPLGVAVMLSLVLGLATTAVAGTGAGAVFNLGQTNTVNAMSKLVGSIAGPNLVIDNNSNDARATALNLQVEAGKAPMKVNSGAKVANLNSDKLDGIDSAAFGRLAESSSSATGTTLQATDQSIATVNITPGTPSGYITANAHIAWESSDLTSTSTVYAALYVPEEDRYLNAWYALETIGTGNQYTNLAVTGALPVTSGGTKTVELRVRRDNFGSGTIKARADVVAAYFPFNGAGGSMAAAGTDATTRDQSDSVGATPR